MKVRNFISGAVLMALLSLTAWAADGGKAKITLNEPATVGTTKLAAGEYKMTWQGTGPNVEVTFSQGKKTLVTVPAQVVQERSGYNSPVVRFNNQTDTLLGVALPKLSFSFTSDGATDTGN